MSYTTVLESAVKQFTRISGLDLAAAGTAWPGSGAGNGIQFANNGRRVVRIRNGSGSGVTVTENYGKTVDGQAITARTGTVAATTGDKAFGPFPPGQYNNDAGMVTIDVSLLTTVTYDVIEMPA